MNNTSNQLPALILAGTRRSTLCLLVLDSASIPMPLQPEEAKRLYSLSSLVLLRVESHQEYKTKESTENIYVSKFKIKLQMNIQEQLHWTAVSNNKISSPMLLSSNNICISIPNHEPSTLLDFSRVYPSREKYKHINVSKFKIKLQMNVSRTTMLGSCFDQ